MAVSVMMTKKRNLKNVRIYGLRRREKIRK